MLVLTRRVGESIRIGDNIVVTLVQMSPGKVRIGIEAPADMTILREELVQTSPAAPLPISPSATTFFSEKGIGG
ncbi:MAG: carbon storage regulator [Pirellulales bacterium]